jgi:hypothetical protein
VTRCVLQHFGDVASGFVGEVGFEAQQNHWMPVRLIRAARVGNVRR